jgi:hypothetical protein
MLIYTRTFGNGINASQLPSSGSSAVGDAGRVSVSTESVPFVAHSQH